MRARVYATSVSIRLLQRLEYGEAKVERFFVAPTTAMDIINRDRARNGTGMLQVLDAAIGIWSQVHVFTRLNTQRREWLVDRPICSLDKCS